MFPELLSRLLTGSQTSGAQFTWQTEAEIGRLSVVGESWEEFLTKAEPLSPELYQERRTPLLSLLSEHRVSTNASFFERVEVKSSTVPQHPLLAKLSKVTKVQRSQNLDGILLLNSSNSKNSYSGSDRYIWNGHHLMWVNVVLSGKNLWHCYKNMQK